MKATTMTGTPGTAGFQSSASDASADASTDGVERSLLEAVLDRPSQPARALPAAKVDGISIGTVTGAGASGVRVSADVPSLADVPAFTLLEVTEADIGRTVALGFRGGAPDQPLVLGFVLDAAPPRSARPPAEALIDGERVVLNAQHEIELRCGDAAIVLSADGRIEFRGTYITSQASATQRILGGSVNIN